MKKKFLGRVLTMLLVASMVFTLLPAPAIAAGNWWWNNDEYTEEAVPTATTDDYDRILHLDCGRKYFTKDWIIALLHEMQAAGYNQLELAFGNDGLRFLLDNMSFTANGTTYDYATIVQKVEAGNKLQNSSNDPRWLTQAEMDKIIETAKSLGIEIVPLLNLPGHANAILDIADDTLNASGSNNTLDVANSEAARNFGMAIFEKYLEYFNGKGCRYFCFGADEYANDASGEFSFSRLDGTQYASFASFINTLSEKIDAKGMTPRAFNDGLYYNGQSMKKSTNTSIEKIQCCYWSPGWSGYSLASASTIKNNKHSLINTNGEFYYVLGKEDKFDSGYSYAENFNDTTFPTFEYGRWGTETISNPVGSMFCIWCDYPNAETETQVAQKTRLVLRAMAARMQNKSIDTISYDVVPGGFNEDGSLTTTTPTPPDGGTTPAEETITVPVNGTKEITVDGDVTVTTGSDYNASIAGYTSVPAPETTTTETPVASPVGKSFYIRNMSGTTGTMYLDGSAKWQPDVSNAEKWICREDGNYSSYYLELDGASPKTYLRLDNGQWKTTNSSYYRTSFYFDSTSTTFITYKGWYTYTLGTPVEVKTDSTPKTLVTFYGLAKGTTYVTIGNVKYTINVTDKAPDTALTGSSITLEHWITNGKVVKQKNSENNTTTISKETNGVQTENGVEIKDYAFTPGYWNKSTEVTYWQAVRLDKDNKQTGEDGVDKTAVGTTLTHVRYQNNAWQYKTLDGNWQYFRSGDQLVAYYLQKIPVTEEITTYFKDYGYRYSELPQNTSGGEGQVALTVAVVYPDGTVSPAEGNMYSKSTTIFNYWNNRNIGIISAANNSEYTISKITVTDGTRVYSNSYYDIVWQNGDTITWNKKLTDDGKTKWYNETVVWDEQTNAGTTPMVNGSDPNCKTVCTWSAKNTAKLVLIYLKPVVKETNLHLAYYDETHNKQIIAPIDIAMTSIGTVTPTFTTALKDANGNVIGDTASWPGTTSSEEGYLPDGAYVVNSSGVNQTFNKNLPTVPGVAPNYKSGVYKYNGADISDDGKTLTLHYVLDESKLALTYVFDFGLPINIPVSDLVGDAASSVETVYVGNTDLSTGIAASQHGKLTYNKSTQYITYEPTKAWTAQGLSSVTFKVEFIDTTTQNFTIGVLPASNVLYEENFLTQSNESGLSWTKVTSDKLGSQETQKAKANGNVFGYDAAYVTNGTKPVTGELGVWKASDLEVNKRTTSALTTDFYGNGFDLIGNCSSTTGRVIMVISNEGGTGKLVDVDTRYAHGDLYQVPLAHVMLPEGKHTASIYAAGLAATTASATGYNLSGAATYASDYAVGGYDTVLSDILAENGLTMADVEYVKVESAPAATTRSAASFYALDTAAETGTVTHGVGTHVEIDGFRVYRSTNNDNYPANEKNVTYENILRVVKGKITAYTENGNGGEVAVADYEKKGGPQNEIYLSKDQSVTFQVGTAPSKIQVSLRAVSGTTSWATSETGDNPASITSNTEMYYPVTTNSDGSITIVNRGEGLLAIGNVKLPGGAVTQSASEMDKDVVLASVRMALGASGEGDTFDPAISAKVTTTRFIRSKVVTLTVSASADVEKLMVNGVELRPTNSWLVKMGWSDTYTYILTEKVQKNEIKTYEIVGYRADGAASETFVVKSK